MDNDKSILEKIADKVKNIANIAADSANEALKPEAPPPKADEYSAAHIPLAADGLQHDPEKVGTGFPKRSCSNKEMRS
jgi:hypothetical protein